MNNNKRSNSINHITLKIKVELTKAMDTPLIYDDNPGQSLEDFMSQNPAPTPKKKENRHWTDGIDQKTLQDVTDIVDAYVDKSLMDYDDYYEMTHCLYDLVQTEKDRMESWMRMIAQSDQKAAEEDVREEGITRCTPADYLNYLRHMGKSRVELYKIIRDKLVDDETEDGEDNE